MLGRWRVIIMWRFDLCFYHVVWRLHIVVLMAAIIAFWYRMWECGKITQLNDHIALLLVRSNGDRLCCHLSSDNAERVVHFGFWMQCHEGQEVIESFSGWSRVGRPMGRTGSWFQAKSGDPPSQVESENPGYRTVFLQLLFLQVASNAVWCRMWQCVNET